MYLKCRCYILKLLAREDFNRNRDAAVLITKIPLTCHLNRAVSLGRKGRKRERDKCIIKSKGFETIVDKSLVYGDSQII